MVLAGDIAAWVAFVECVLFVVLYAVAAPFYRTEEGTHLLSFSLFLAATLGYIVFATAKRMAEPQSPVVRLVILGGLAVFMGWRLSLVIRHQIIPRLRDRNKGEGTNATTF